MAAPKLRFKAFIKPYKNIKYEEFAPLQRGFDLPVSTIVDGEYPVVFSNGILKKHNSFKAKAPGVVTGRSGTIGNITWVDKDYWPHNTSLWVTNFFDNDPRYIFYFLQDFDVSRFASGSGVPTLNRNDVHAQLIHIPTDRNEQSKIASFLSAVDEKISQLTQKHQLLSQYKQGMMQKLFSQQIRFKADDGSEFGEWEDKRISEIASYRRGSFPQPYGLPEWLNENGFPFVQVYDVADNMLLKDKTKIKISQLAANQSVFAKTGTLIITLQGSIGRVAKMQYDAYVDRTLLIFQSYSMPINTDYFKYALYLLFNIEKEKADGGIIKTITKETLSKFNIGIPCLEEQTKIANFLSAMDQKIEVVAQQIEQAKQWKKGLLQQMFV